MKKCIFDGVGTAIVTPMINGEIDYTSLMIMLDRQIMANIDAVIILGTTGEPCTLSNKERDKVIKFVVSYCKGRTKVIVGCGGNSTKAVMENYKKAESFGADGALIVTPYYNKCTQDGLIQHYMAVADCGNLPIIVYNVPSRTGVNIEPKTLERLAKIDNICGIKEASGNISQLLEYFRVVGDQLSIYSGDDLLNYIFYAMGAKGCISVLSNVMPRVSKKIYDECCAGEYENAKNLQLRILPFINSLFSEVNPIPVKAALSHLGLCKNDLRLPLCKMSENNFEKLKTELELAWVEEDDCM